MTAKPRIRLLGYSVDSCPRCKMNHEYVLKVIISAPEDKVHIFGGPEQKIEGKSEILLECPNKRESFTRQIQNPSDGEIVGLATPEDISAAAYTPLDASSLVDNDFAEWIKNSPSRATDFCKTMITLSTGAVAVYFAVQNYLGFEKIGDTVLGKIGILPPVLFLVSALFFVLGLHPQSDLISRTEFLAWRAQVLTRMNRFVMVGTSVFLGGIAVSIVMLFSTLSR
jgi:hypothetical protein